MQSKLALQRIPQSHTKAVKQDQGFKKPAAHGDPEVPPIHWPWSQLQKQAPCLSLTLLPLGHKNRAGVVSRGCGDTTSLGPWLGALEYVCLKLLIYIITFINYGKARIYWHVGHFVGANM